jgi:hypothetical protein
MFFLMKSAITINSLVRDGNRVGAFLVVRYIMMANPNSENPVFALIVTGEDYMFVKLNQQSRQYARSKKFTIANPQDNELYDIVWVMKRIIDLSVQH